MELAINILWILVLLLLALPGIIFLMCVFKVLKKVNDYYDEEREDF